MIVPSFTAKGGITSVVSGYRGSELESNYQIHYIETYCDGGKTAKLRKALASYARFLKELICFRPDLVHIHSSFGASFYRKAPFIYLSAFCNIPVVNHIHGAQWDSFYGNASERSKRFKKKLFQKCSCVIALSEEWKHNLKEAVDPAKIKIVANFGPLAESTSERSLKSSRNVLFLGFLSERKGCFDIPEVVALVRRKVQDAIFVLAGDGNEADVQHINSLAQEFGVEDYLHFPGWVSGNKKDEHLKNASVFFLPSYAEGMPMSILEAMGYGLPVVSTTVGGIPQLITDGESGFLLAPGDTEGFANAIITLLQDPERGTAMGASGRAFVQRHYSLKKHTDSLADIYGSLL